MVLESQTMFKLKIISEMSLQLSPMTQILSQQSPLLSHVQELKIDVDEAQWVNHVWQTFSDPGPSEWLELLRLFIAVQSLYVSIRGMPLIMSALQELAEGRAMEVLPALRDLSVERTQPEEDATESLVAARQLSFHPVTVVQPEDWYPDEDQE